jgi:hypothetical protein
MTPKAGIVQPEGTFLARQRLGKHVPVATKTQATIEVLLETMLKLHGGQAYYRSSD